MILMSPDATLSFEAGLVPARGQEGLGVRVGRIALDQDVVALRDLLEDRVRLGLADADVVERDVQGARVLDQAVIADDRDARRLGLRRPPAGSAFGVLGQHDEDLGALRDHGVDVGRLLLALEVGVGIDVLAAGGLDRLLDVRLVMGRPARLLEVVPRHADRAAGPTRSGGGGGSTCACRQDFRRYCCCRPLR